MAIQTKRATVYLAPELHKALRLKAGLCERMLFPEPGNETLLGKQFS